MTHRVVVVGGGFGGLPACRFLAHRPVEVTLIDRRNHHLFQPLLYQVATGILSSGQISPPLRKVLRRHRNVRVELAEVTGFDLDRRVVHAKSPFHDPVDVPYDSLIVAAGVTQSYFGHDELALFAPGMKTVDDALELRRRIFGAFEMAEVTTDPDEKQAWLTIVVVGAGPTGVELAGQVRELAGRSLHRNFRTFDPASVRVVLLDAGKEPLATFGDRLSSRAAAMLEKLGVELRMGARVTNVDVSGVEVQTDAGADRIPTHVTVWAAGVQA
jgi:NADH dehydrogenase